MGLSIVFKNRYWVRVFVRNTPDISVSKHGVGLNTYATCGDWQNVNWNNYDYHITLYRASPPYKHQPTFHWHQCHKQERVKIDVCLQTEFLVLSLIVSRDFKATVTWWRPAAPIYYDLVSNRCVYDNTVQLHLALGINQSTQQLCNWVGKNNNNNKKKKPHYRRPRTRC